MANIARRLTLGLPICLDESEHRDRGDGYCNCGTDLSSKPGTKRRGVKYAAEGHPVPRPRMNLDIIERNEDNR